MKRNLIILAVLLLAAGAVIYNQAGPEIKAVFMEEPLPTEVGARDGLLAPSFTLKGMDDVTYSAGGQRDKAIIVNFWASWCDPCKEEAPELMKLAAKYEQDLDVYGVNVTKYDNEKNARAFVEDYGLTYPILFDPDGEVYEQLYKGKVFPTNVLIDKNGVIQEIILGAPRPQDLEKKVARLIR